jgi:hypothetical protein
VTRPIVRLVPAVLLALALISCGSGGDEAEPGPRLDLIEEAVAAVEDHYGAPQEYFEISADLDRVSVIVAVDNDASGAATAAEQGYFDDDGLLPPEPVGPASGSTFVAAAIDFDAGRIFDQLRDELDDPTIADFAVQGGPNGSVIYDATVLSDAGGRILVLLGADGEVLGAQAA